MIAPLDLEVLEALAQAATPPPWFHDTGALCNGVSQGTSYRNRGASVADETRWADGAYIAAFHPGVVLDLLAELKSLRARVGDLEQVVADSVSVEQVRALVGATREARVRR